jgi:ubiquinone/menaquinone biosynthesis C-methylase UbiE
MNYKPVPALGKNILTPFFDFLVEVVGLGTSFKEKVLERVHFQNGERLLDVGCGTATLLIAAKSHNPDSQVFGIDVDERVLDIAKRKIQKTRVEVEVMKARAEDLPFESSSFDVVVSTLIFHHLPTKIKKLAMREIHRVLKQDGRFLLADFGKPESVLLKTFFALGAMVRSDEAKYLQDNREGRLPLFLEEAGFEVTEVRPRYKGIPFLLATKK